MVNSAQAVEVVTILRDVMDGGLIIQMGDKIYRNLSSDETFTERFLGPSCVSCRRW